MKTIIQTAYVTTPTEYSTTETILILIAAAVFCVLFFLVVYRLRVKDQRKIGHISHILTDKNPRYLHLISERSLMKNNLSFFRHLVFDLSEKKCYAGGGQKGNKLQFGSPFMQRSVAALTEKLHVKLKPHFPEDDEDPDFDQWESEEEWEDWDDSGEHHEPELESIEIEVVDYEEPPLTEIPIHHRYTNDDLLRSDKINDSTYFLLTENEQNEQSTLTYVRNNKRMGKYNLKLKYDNLNNLLILQNGKLACFSYEKSTFSGSSQALCLLNLESGVLEYDQVIRV